jgi:nucleotide-binding universal stress UspA family protein
MRATSLRPVTSVTASEERSGQYALRRTQSVKTATARTAVGFRNILFATDFSPAAAHAIPYVKRIAKRYDANLVALHVRPPVVNPMTEPAYWPDKETIRKENEEHREQLLDMFAGIRTIPLIEEGDIQSRLQEAIAKSNTDLVVMDCSRTITRFKETATRLTGCSFRGRQRSETFARNLSEDARRFSRGFAADEILRRRRDATSDLKARRRIICAVPMGLNKTKAASPARCGRTDSFAS